MLTADDMPDIAAATVDCEVCGETLPISATLEASRADQRASGNYVTVTLDPTDVEAHYLAHEA